MPKRRDTDDSSDNLLSVPLPIQTFLWRQTSPFIRPKLGRLREASCMEQREACKSFEKVLVQNIQFGLSPSLTEAIKSISRWHLVQASLPHVMHCCAALLYTRKDRCLDKLGASETKLLYTLHWIILDAAEECADAEAEKGIIRPSSHYLLPITSIQVFIYLFAPLAGFLKHNDFFTSFRLENGLKIWEPLWAFCHPNVPCFTSHVRPRRSILKARRDCKSHTKFGDVFLGADELVPIIGQLPSLESSDTSQGPAAASPTSSFAPSLVKEQISVEEKRKTSDSDPKSDICEICFAPVKKGESDSPTCKCQSSSLSPVVAKEDSEKKKKSGALSDLSMATFLDVAVLRSLFVSQWFEEGVHWGLQFLFNRLRDIVAEQSHTMHTRKRSNSLPIPQIEVSLYQSPEQKRRELESDAPTTDHCFLLDSPFAPPSHHSSMQELRHSSLSGPSEKPKHKRMKIGDFRLFVEEKLRLSERLLDRIGRDDTHSEVATHDDPDVAGLSYEANKLISSKDFVSTSDLQTPPRPKSAQGILDHQEEVVLINKPEMVRGNSMPSLHIIGDKTMPRAEVLSKLGKMSLPPGLVTTKKMPAFHTQSVPNPIITVTEHSPVTSVQFFLNQESSDSPLREESPPPATGPLIGSLPCRQLSITRSQTDSNISYVPEEISEATGTTHYITQEGEISFPVVLKAVHAVTLRDNTCSLRVCEVILNLLDLFVSVGLLSSRWEQQHSMDTDGDSLLLDSSKGLEGSEPSKTATDKNCQELTIHQLFLDSVLRVIKHLGCPHGCGEGQRSPAADLLRSQAQNILLTLHQNDQSQFRKFLREMIAHRSLAEIVDIFHAFVGFCSEPGSILSPLGQKRTSTGSSQDSNSRVGYANNFGAGFSLGPKGIEGSMMGCIFKPLTGRLVELHKELKSQENMALYCDVRQLISYIRDNHGGIFRRVALSGLLDSADRPYKDKQTTPTTRIVRHSKSVDHDECRDPLYSPALFVVDETMAEKTSRKSFFRKKGVRKTPSASNILDEDISGCPSPALWQHRAVTPRLSLSEDEAQLATSTPKPKGSKFQIVNWLKGDRQQQRGGQGDQDDEEEGVSSVAPEAGGFSSLTPGGPDGRLSRRPSTMNRTPKMGHKTSSHMSLTLLRARKRMEDHLNKIGFGRNKNKHGSFEEPLDLSRRNSYDFEHGMHEGDMLLLKESKLVNVEVVRRGMHCFSFLLEATQPGSLPDPPLLAAALNLRAPVVARAALYLECAYFVHRCNKGQWPSWMKLNLPVFRPSGPLANRGTPSGPRRTHILQKAAGHMFYQWAEAIGARLEEMQSREMAEVSSGEGLGNNSSMDESKRRQLRIEDEEEDFLDEASVNPSGCGCPFALKMAACQLLLEITAFLRETYQYLPHKSSRMSMRERPVQPGFEPRSITANRRWSMALSSLGFSQNSAHSLVSLAEQTHPMQLGERRISFVLHEADVEAESENSSNTTVTAQGEEGTKEEESKRGTSGRRIAQGRPHLLRRTPGALPPAGHNSSFKRRSLKLKKTGDRKNRPRSSTFAEDEEETALHRAESICSRRKVSGVSDRSDTSERADVSGEESPGVLSDDQPPESPIDVLESDDTSLTKSMPWLKVISQVTRTLNFQCPHLHSCHQNCYKRQMRACKRLEKTIRKVYGDDFGMTPAGEKQQEDKDDNKKDKKIKKIITAPSSPLRRKASVPHTLDRFERGDLQQHLSGHRSLHSSTTFLSHDLELGTSHDSKGLDQKGLPSRCTLQKPKEEDPLLKYVKTQVRGLFHTPLSAILKGAVVLTEENFVSIMAVAWELVLESDQQVASTAAVLFILASIKTPEPATEMFMQELHHEEPSRRLNAILRFQAMWKFRYQCWPRMEEGAHMIFKVPPPAIEFTLPSPKIALDSVPVADPPWMPHVKAKVEEVTINQDQTLQRSFVTATKTRRKQQMELVHRALQEEEEKKRNERENFHISSVPVNIQAAYEPALYHIPDEHEEGDEDLQTERSPGHHLQIANALFPSCLCAAALPIINLFDDPQVNSEGVAVYEVAYRAMWTCLVEDTALFLRHILEKLTREKQDTMIQILRRVFRFVPRLPAQAAYTVYNYLVGFVMFYVRTPSEAGQELIGSALSVMWLVIPSVQGLFLKDLKQILRKEQCDATLLITANVPSAKKIIVHGPDASGIPSQFPIHEDTQFSHILQDSIDFFSVDEDQIDAHFLVDMKTNQMHNLSAFVRDFYFFKRSQYPQLSMVHMNPQEAFDTLQKQAFMLRFVELGKIMMSLSIVKSQYQAPQRVLFLHEELMKLPAFPRKALEADFGLYSGTLGKELLGMDTLHKMVWVKLVARMFEVMTGFFVHSSDIHLFVNVINGALVLHCEDSSVTRFCMATYINAAQQFKNIFATNGYMLIMPTILRIYSNHQTNGLLCRTVEFVCKQFYIMHRKPFVLQMFGSIAPILDMDTTGNYGDAHKVQPKAMFQLMLSMGQHTVDPLDILELVEGEKPLRALDFCYQMDPETISLLDAISLCVTVVSYSADSQRGNQMLTILEAILPFYLRHLQNLTTRRETPGGPRTELAMIHNVAVCMKTLVNNCEALARNYSGPQRAIDLRGSSIKNASRGAVSPPYEMDEDSHSKYVSDNYYSRKAQAQYEVEDSETLRSEFRRPRDTLLNVVCEFMTKCSARLADLSKKIPDLSSKTTELLDVKCHLRLAEVAHSLLKVSPYDPATMACHGLRRYLNEVLPLSEWSQEAMRPALIMVLRRLDKTFNKIAKKPAIRRLVDWDAARSLLKGVYLTLFRHPYIAHLPHLKSLIAVCQSILLGDQTSSLLNESSSNLMSCWGMSLGQAPPLGFCSVVVRLVAMQMSALGDSLSLESVCGGGSVVSSPEKTEVYLMNLILPMCIRISSDVKNVPKLRPVDISYALTVVLSALTPPASAKHGATSSKNTTDSQVMDKSPTRIRNTLIQIGFLGLKILIVCFERQLAVDWHRIACCIRDMGNKVQGGLSLWNFLDFVVTHRTPLFVLLYPFINYKVLQTICDNEHEYYYQQLIREKLQGFSLPPPKSRGQLFLDVVSEIKDIKEDMIARKLGADLDRRMSMNGDSPPVDLSQSASFGRGGGGLACMGSTTSSQQPLGVPPCPSFTELSADRQSITRLGNPPGMISNAPTNSRTRLASTSSITSATGILPAVSVGNTVAAPPSGLVTSGSQPQLLKGKPLSRDWNTQSERYPHGHHPHPHGGGGGTARGLSIKLTSRETGRRVMERFLRRTSFPFPEEENNSSQEMLGSEQMAASEPRLYRKSTLHIKKRGSKRSTSGGSSTLFSEGSDGGLNNQDDDMRLDIQESGPSSQSLAEDQALQSPDADEAKPRHRLQRQKAQSRKTFRFRKSRRGAGFAPHDEKGEGPEEIPLGSTPGHKRPREEGNTEEEIGHRDPSADTAAVEVDALPMIKKGEDSMDYRAPRRRGAMHRSHSPSPSPERASSPSNTPQQQQQGSGGDAYIKQCESTESLSLSENAALLKSDEKRSGSHSSLLMVFPPAKEEPNCH